MITVDQYFGAKPHSDEQRAAALHLLGKVNSMMDEAEATGVVFSIDPDTGTQISGSKGGAGDGGFRLPEATTGSPKSAHKRAMAVDVYDPGGKFDAWINDDMLECYDLYREHPDSTPGWCHLQTRCPLSGRRTFTP